MGIADKTVYVKEPNELACGQAVLAMVSGKDVYEVIKEVKTERETKLLDMFLFFDNNKIKYSSIKKEAKTKADLPKICLLSLETPRCWHWSYYRDGVFYDPEHGVSDDFPVSGRKYFFEIYE